MNKTIINLYLITCGTMFVDMAIQIAVIWQILSMTGSSFYVGLIVCIGALMPLLISQLPLLKKDLLRLKTVLILRCSIALIFMLTAYITQMTIIWLFFLIAIFASSSMIISLNFMEKQNTILIKSNLLSSEKGARYIQTAIQTGAFMGAFIGAWLLNEFGFYIFILLTSTASLVVALSYLFLKTPYAKLSEKKDNTATAPKISTDNLHQSGNITSFKSQILVVAITGLHVGAFNSLLPVYFQLFREWDATIFGAASGLAGLGALSASLFKHLKYQYIISILLLAIGDILIVYFEQSKLAILAGFLIGFSINTLRIHSRKIMLSSTANESATIKAISSSNYFFFFLSGLTPLCLTGILTFYNSATIEYGRILILVGITCSIVLLINTIYKNKYN